MPAPLPIVRQCPRPFPRPSLRLDAAAGDGAPGQASDAFNAALRHRLGKKTVVVVDMTRPFSTDGAIPAELAPWVSEVKASGGHVTTVSYCQANRGLFSALRGLFGGHPTNIYAAADTFDLVFHVDGAKAVVTQVEFHPRAAP